MTPLLFDMDGLLLDTERVAMRAFRDLAVEAGMVAKDADTAFLGLIGSSAAQTKARLFEILPSGTDVAGFGQQWSDLFSDILLAGVPLRPHVDKVIPRLAAAGHPMAVVTSTIGDRARSHLSHVGLLEHFQVVVGGDEVSANKPDPAPYLAGAARLGVDATACMAFEDSDKGVASAVAAGCAVVQIPDLRPANTPLPALGQRVAQDLQAALAFL